MIGIIENCFPLRDWLDFSSAPLISCSTTIYKPDRQPCSNPKQLQPFVHHLMLGKWPSFADLLITISTGQLKWSALCTDSSNAFTSLRSAEFLVENFTLQPSGPSSAAFCKYPVQCFSFSFKVLEIYEVLNSNFRLRKQTHLAKIWLPFNKFSKTRLQKSSTYLKSCLQTVTMDSEG